MPSPRGSSGCGRRARAERVRDRLLSSSPAFASLTRRGFPAFALARGGSAGTHARMDGTSLERLLAERAWLARVARGLVQDPGAEEDLAQDALVAAWRKGPAAAESWRAWLGATVRRLARRSSRARERRERRERSVAREEALPSSAELVAKSELLELVAR